MSWFVRGLIDRRFRLVLGGIAGIAAACTLAWWLFYLHRLTDPAFKALVESSGMDAYTGEAIDRTKAAEWSQRVSEQIAPHWQKIDPAAGIAVLALGLVLISFMLARMLQKGRTWILSPWFVAVLVTGASVLMPVVFVAMALQQVDRGLVPVYADSLGPILMALPPLLLISLLFLLGMNFVLVWLKGTRSFAVLVRSWSMPGAAVRNLAIVLILVGLIGIMGLLAMHPYSSLVAVLLALAALCVLCRGETASNRLSQSQ